MLLKFTFVFLNFIIVAINLSTSAPIDDKKSEVKIIKYQYRQLPNNGYHFYYEQSDGQTRDEFGSFDNELGILRITGTYSYIGDDKKLYEVQYTADENGYESNVNVVDENTHTTTEESVQLSAAVIAALSG